jgi:hypothetical protein
MIVWTILPYELFFRPKIYQAGLFKAAFLITLRLYIQYQLQKAIYCLCKIMILIINTMMLIGFLNVKGLD